MTQKPEKLGCSKRRVWEGTEPPRDSYTWLKPTLLLANSEDSVAEKLVEQSEHSYLNKVSNRTANHRSEFASRLSTPIKNLHPDYLNTSHQSKTPQQSLQLKTKLPSLLLKTQLQSLQSKTRAYSFNTNNRLTSLPVYQSLVDPTVKWKANIPPSFVSVDDSQGNEQHDDNCWCESCTIARYRAGIGLDSKPVPVHKPTPTPTFNRPIFFHDKIVTFCNRCTMTPRLNDVSCGSSKCVFPLLITTEMGTSSTILNTPQPSKSCRQNSILKKPQCDTYEDLSCFAKTWLDHKSLPSCVDDSNCNGRTKPTKCYPRSAYLQSLNNNMITCKVETDASKRKMLYNEGISDDVAKQLCVMHKKHPPTYDFHQRTCSRLSIGGKCYRDSSDNYIPYSHNINSKYHLNCKKELPLMRKRSYVLRGVTNDECHTLKLEPLMLKRDSAGVCLTRSRCISLPKKLLTSEKNIEAFLKPKWTRQSPQ